MPRREEARPGRHAATPVVGRDEELSVLEAGLDDALAGRGRLFIVVGGPGAGKTQLADELASRAKARGAKILWGRGWHGGGAPPFWPWSQAMRTAKRSLPEPASDDEAGRFRFFEAVTEVLRAETTDQPVLLVLDDLQAADEDTLLLLEFLASEVPEMALLVLALAREDADRVGELGRHATRTLRLQPP
jgi:predicted ATPase